jgi:hypothetical protein
VLSHKIRIQFTAPVLRDILPLYVDWFMNGVNVVSDFVIKDISGHHVAEEWYAQRRSRIPGDIVHVQPHRSGRGFRRPRIGAGGISEKYFTDP